jgi:hypothetical protein
MGRLRLQKPTNVYLAYSNLGWDWSYVGSFEEIIKQHEQETNSLQKIDSIAFSEINNKLKEDKEFLNYFERVKNVKLRYIYKKMGFETPVEYIKKMYYLVNYENLTSQQIARHYNIHGRSMQTHLGNIELNRDRQTANEIAVMNGRRNFQKSRNNSIKTAVNNFNETGLVGSREENIARTSLETLLINYFNSKRFEIIVGINNHFIIPPKEVDIPVIIINKATQKIYKIAIEFNGDGFHDEDDKIKKENLIQNGWIYYSIWYRDNTSQFQKEVYGSTEKQLKECCGEIKKIVNSSI